MKKQHNEGFSLVEVLVAMAVLALVVVPTCSGIILSFRMNAKTDQMMKAQMAVSSAVETLMAEGISPETDITRFPDVTIVTEPVTDGAESPTTLYYKVTVSTSDPAVSVTTHIRAVEPPPETTAPSGGGAVG